MFDFNVDIHTFIHTFCIFALKRLLNVLLSDVKISLLDWIVDVTKINMALKGLKVMSH